MKLIIVESPSKVAPIEKYIKSVDKDIVVCASGGHIRKLANSGIGGYGVDVENGFEPKFVSEASKAKFIKEMKKHAKNADELYLATDPDREGEAIAFHILKTLKFDENKTKRITYNQITKEAIIEAFQNPKELNESLIESQFTRQILDKIMGYSLSKVIQKKIKSQSAGRVQSVALKIVSEKENQINNFVPLKFFDLSLLLNGIYEGIKSDLIKIDNKTINVEKKIGVYEEKEAKNIENIVKNEGVVVKSFKEVDKLSLPKAPFQTSTLQQSASSLLGFSPRKTMQIAQKLYEGTEINKEHIGLITYMRTDSNIISTSAKTQIKKYIKESIDPNLLSSKQLFKSKKTTNSQEAHEGIRPTNINLTPKTLVNLLSKDEYKLYQLIWARTVSAFMKAAIYKSRIVEFSSDKYTFKSSGKELVFDGYLRVYGNYVKETDNLLPIFNIGEIISDYKINSKENSTKPSPRFSEASLIKRLEDLGIGRPSTFASVLDTLKIRNYIEIDKRSICVTERGLKTNVVLQEYFNNLINENYTANMEKYLDDIAKGKIIWNTKLEEFYTKELLPSVDNAMQNAEKVEDEKVGKSCPTCNSDLVYKYTRMGVKFIACSTWPSCKYSESITMDVDCPYCNEGKIAKLKTKRGKDFYVCVNKECKKMFWNVPTKEKCKECSSFLTKKVENNLICENRECELYNKKIEINLEN